VEAARLPSVPEDAAREWVRSDGLVPLGFCATVLVRRCESWRACGAGAVSGGSRAPCGSSGPRAKTRARTHARRARGRGCSGGGGSGEAQEGGPGGRPRREAPAAPSGSLWRRRNGGSGAAANRGRCGARWGSRSRRRAGRPATISVGAEKNGPPGAPGRGEGARARGLEEGGRKRPGRGRRHRLQVRPQAGRARPTTTAPRRFPVPERNRGRPDPGRPGDSPPRVPGRPDDGELRATKRARRTGGRGTLPHELRSPESQAGNSRS